jgi:hypothetical protein
LIIEDSILEHATGEQLELAVEEDLFALFGAMSALPGRSMVRINHYLWRNC